MANQHYTLWVKSECPFCTQAQSELLTNIKSHTVHVMDGRQEELDEVQTYWDHTTVPVVVLLEDDKEIFIGGYTELKEHLETKEV
tara:strand:- start:181 stop:435 length:255 start_codon:yes stop_codon:yes gene_type:complete